jgi:hypothetical protein
METPLILIAIIVMLGLVYVVLPLVSHTYQRFRKRKVIICPETNGLAEITINARWAALTSAFRKPLLRVRGCTLWPKKKGCAEDCVKQD